MRPTPGEAEVAIFVTVVALVLIMVGATSIWWSADRSGRTRRRLLLGGGTLLLLGATLARAPAVDDRLPYLAYVDEGHVLHPAQRMIANHSWDPEWYRYPSFTMDLTVAGTAAYALLPGDQPIERGTHGGPSDYYDLGLAPPVIAAGRVLVLILSVATVALIGVAALRLAGPRAAAPAAALAAVLPALALRSATVNVHAPAVCFVAVSLAAAAHLTMSRRSATAAVVAGAGSGVAFTSMYVAGAVLVLVSVTILTLDELPRRRFVLLASCLGAWVLTVAVTMPAFVFRWSDVWTDIGEQAEIYATRTSPTAFADVLWRFDELGWPYIVLAVAGLVSLVVRSRTRSVALGAGAFALVFLGYLVRFDYQPFQTLLPLYPVALVLGGAALASLTEHTNRDLVSGAGRYLAGLVVAPLLLVGATVGVHPTIDDPPEDTRTRAVQWLEENASDDHIVFAEELAFLPSQLAEMTAPASVVPLADLPEAARSMDARFLVVPASDEHQGFEEVVRFGRRPTPPHPEFWRGNAQIVRILSSTAQ